MEISCAFPTALDSPDHIALAEELGYDRAWLYDTPQQSTDVWVTLALAAERTERIGLGPGVLVPSLRHPMVNAAATANLAALAPGRVVVAFGTGFTGRRAMGYRAIKWEFMDEYIRAYRGLLRGETIEWEGARMRMLHPPGHGAPAAGRRADQHRRARAQGRRGRARARRRPLHHARAARVRHGVLAGSPTCSGARSATTARSRTPIACARPAGRAGRSPTTAPTSSGRRSRTCRAARSGRRWSSGPRRRSATSPSTSSTASGSTRPTRRPGRRAATQMLDEVTVSGTADQVRERLAGLAEHGVTEVVFQPCGPDVRRELEVFMDTAKSAVRLSEQMTTRDADDPVRGRQLLRVPALARRPLVGRRTSTGTRSSPTTPTGTRSSCSRSRASPPASAGCPTATCSSSR